MPNARTDTDHEWNSHVTLHLQDRLVAALFLRFIPKRVRPNHVTVLRMLLTPVVLVFMWYEAWSIAVPLFIFTAFTDMIDGSLARVRKQVTTWGVIFDPFADKLLIGSVLFLIVVQHVNYVLGWAILAIEAVMIGGAMLRHRQGIVRQANILGKVKMVMEVIGVSLLLTALWLDMSLLVDLSMGSLALAIVVAVLSVLPHLHK